MPVPNSERSSIFQQQPIKEILKEDTIFEMLSYPQFRALLDRVILTRHGRTPLNDQRVLQGSSDTQLSEGGRAEMREQYEKLMAAGIPIEMIFTSEMQRARQTAQIFSGDQQGLVEVTSGIHEYNYGDWEGSPVTEILADQNKEAWTKQRMTLEAEFGPKGGEGFVAFLARINDGLVRIASRVQETQSASHGRMLIICHAEVLRAIRFLYLLSKDGKAATRAHLQALEARFSFQDDGIFLKVPHGMVEIAEDGSLSSLIFYGGPAPKPPVSPDSL